MAAAGAPVNNTNKKVTFKVFAPFFICISEMNNTQVDFTPDIDIEMLAYNLIEHSDIYSKTSQSLWMYYRDESALDNNNIIESPNNNNSISFKFKENIIRQTANGGTKNVEIMVLLKYLSNFWRNFEMPLIKCEINLQLKWSRIVFQSLVLQHFKY